MSGTGVSPHALPVPEVPMKLDIATAGGRAVLLACVVVLPFLRFLIRNRYPMATPEALAAAAVLATVCLLLAAVIRTPTLFLCVVAACSVMMATVPVMRLCSGWVEVTAGQSALLLGVLLAGAVTLMREKFAVVLIVFTTSVFAVDLTMSLAAPGPPVIPAAEPESYALSHVLYIVLDEHVGAAGLPRQFEECRCAGSKMNEVLQRHYFRHFTHAYSNYPSTVSSLASVLNRHLLERRRSYLDENSSQWRWGTRRFLQNRLLSRFEDKGYAIEVFQHRAINHVAPQINAGVQEYWDQLGRLQRAAGSWQLRFRWLVGNYQQSDLVLSQVKAFFPFRFAPHTMGPLAAEDVWPEGVLASMRASKARTLFFVHVMAPHFPYLYRRNGTVRSMEEWIGDRVDQRSNATLYENRYRRYCEQVEFVSGQLDRLFTGMREAGLFDSATIVVHGDHGPRIRKTFSANDPAGRPAGSDPEQYDYPAGPQLRDLLDRFSTLLAAKGPYATSAASEDRKGSLVRFLNEILPLDTGPLPASADSVFLFDARGRPREIRILDYWSHPL